MFLELFYIWTRFDVLTLTPIQTVVLREWFHVVWWKLETFRRNSVFILILIWIYFEYGTSTLLQGATLQKGTDLEAKASLGIQTTAPCEENLRVVAPEIRAVAVTKGRLYEIHSANAKWRPNVIRAMWFTREQLMKARGGVEV